MMRYEFHPAALQEYDEAASYYASRHRGLELRFIEAVEQAILRIRETPERWRILDGDVRDASLSPLCTGTGSRVTGVAGLNDLIEL